MKFPDWLPVYGDTRYRGPCPAESVEQATAISYIRREWPNAYGVLVLHPRNEGKRNWRQAAKHRAEGMTTGASDIIIPARVPFVCEIKREDHTKSRWEDGQREYLAAALKAGAFVCVALGAEGVKEALNDYQKAICRARRAPA